MCPCAGYITEPERKELANGAVVVKFRVGVLKQVSVLDGEEEPPEKGKEEKEEKKEKDWYSPTHTSLQAQRPEVVAPCFR